MRTILVDPPRAGLDDETLKLLRRFERFEASAHSGLTAAPTSHLLAPISRDLVSAAKSLTYCIWHDVSVCLRCADLEARPAADLPSTPLVGLTEPVGLQRVRWVLPCPQDRVHLVQPGHAGVEPGGRRRQPPGAALRPVRSVPRDGAHRVRRVLRAAIGAHRALTARTGGKSSPGTAGATRSRFRRT